MSRPYGAALRDWFRGDRGGGLALRSDLGEHDEMPVEVFFREPEGFFAFERTAVELCRGRVLDVGSGTGLHALVLQELGHDVVALDVEPDAAAIARERGVRDVREADVFEFEDDSPFDTVLMLMNGVGIVETLEGLARYLGRVERLLAADGQLLLDSADLRSEEEKAAGASPRREDGRYMGEAQIQLEYRGLRGEPFRELYVDPDTLFRVAGEAGWTAEVVHRSEDGIGYLARLVRGGDGGGPFASPGV